MKKSVTSITLWLILVMSLFLNPSGSQTQQQNVGIPSVYASGITRIQNASGVWSLGNSFTVTLTSTPTNGNDLLIYIGLYASGGGQPRISTVSQTGATWTQVTSQDTLKHDVALWQALNVLGAGRTITVTLSETVTDGVADAFEYSGLATISPLDQHNNTSNGSGTATNTGSVTTTQPNELWFGAVEFLNGRQRAPTNGFTLIDGAQHISISLAVLEKIVSSTGIADSGTTGSASSNWRGLMATFIAAPTATTSTTILTTVVSTTSTTSSTNTTSTVTGTTVIASTTLSTTTNATTVTGTTSATSTVTGPTAGTTTSTFTSIVSTSTTTNLMTSPAVETITQTGVITLSTASSNSTTSTGTTYTTTTAGGTVTVTETDTFNVLLTNVYQELDQLADEFLQLIGFQPVTTPVGQQVNQVITTTTATTTPTRVTMNVSYSVVGGGSPKAPVFHYVLKGASKTLTLTKTAKAVSVDAGSAWSVTPNPLSGSNSTQQWIPTQPLTGTASATTIQFVFQHQYFLTMLISGPGTVTPSSGWYNANQKVTIKATPNATHKFNSWTGTGTGSFTGTTASHTITMKAAITETATFT